MNALRKSTNMRKDCYITLGADKWPLETVKLLENRLGWSQRRQQNGVTAPAQRTASFIAQLARAAPLQAR